MRVIGILLAVFGIIALAVPSITFFTTERAVDAGRLMVDVQEPHTIVLNPIAGIVAEIAGVAILLAAPGPRPYEPDLVCSGHGFSSRQRSGQ
jgi:hypothetical protein